MRNLTAPITVHGDAAWAPAAQADCWVNALNGISSYGTNTAPTGAGCPAAQPRHPHALSLPCGACCAPLATTPAPCRHRALLPRRPQRIRLLTRVDRLPPAAPAATYTAQLNMWVQGSASLMSNGTLLGAELYKLLNLTAGLGRLGKLEVGGGRGAAASPAHAARPAPLACC